MTFWCVGLLVCEGRGRVLCAGEFGVGEKERGLATDRNGAREKFLKKVVGRGCGG